MTEIGLFPLGIVLLPTERIPLHIFEARYRELIGECLDLEQEFGLVLIDAAGMRDVGTRASVMEVHQRFADGRLNILVEGGERFRIVEMTSGRSFDTAEVEPLEDDGEPAPEERVQQALARFRQLVAIAESEGVDEPDPASRFLSFELASRVDFGTDLKQELLELRSERERLARVAEALQRATMSLALEKEIQHRAGGNGKVSR